MQMPLRRSENGGFLYQLHPNVPPDGRFDEPSMMPAIDRGLVRSLYLLGAGFQASGYRKRPSFPKQSLVCHILKRELAHHREERNSNYLICHFQILFPGPRRSFSRSAGRGMAEHFELSGR